MYLYTWHYLNIWRPGRRKNRGQKEWNSIRYLLFLFLHEIRDFEPCLYKHIFSWLQMHCFVRFSVLFWDDLYIHKNISILQLGSWLLSISSLIMDRSLNEILFSYTILILQWYDVNIWEGDFMKYCFPCLRKVTDPCISMKRWLTMGEQSYIFPQKQNMIFYHLYSCMSKFIFFFPLLCSDPGWGCSCIWYVSWSWNSRKWEKGGLWLQVGTFSFPYDQEECISCCMYTERATRYVLFP